MYYVFVLPVSLGLAQRFYTKVELKNLLGAICMEEAIQAMDIAIDL